MDILLTDSLVTSPSTGFLDETTVRTLVLAWYGISQKVQETGPPFGGEWVENYLSPAAADTHRAEAVSILGSPSTSRALVGATDNADLGLGWRGRLAVVAGCYHRRR